jgi:hypothetical protein
MPPYQGVFEKMNFPKYSFQEYPKWVDGPKGRVLVQSKQEEIRLEMERPVEETAVNPLAEENARLAKEVAELRALMNTAGEAKLDAKAKAVAKAEEEEKDRLAKVKADEEAAEAAKVKSTLAAQKPKSLAETLKA